MATRLIRTLMPVLLLAGCSPASDAAPAADPNQGADVRSAPVRDGAAAAAAEATTDRAVLAGTQTLLIARGQACLVRRSGKPDIPLAPAAPCRFLRVDGQVQQHAYPARGIDAVVMVVGTAADAAGKARFGIPAALECGTVAHGLIIRGDSMAPARQAHRGAMVCVDQGRDEKDFYAVAHDG